MSFLIWTVVVYSEQKSSSGKKKESKTVCKMGESGKRADFKGN